MDRASLCLQTGDLYLLGLTQHVPPEDGDRIQFPKHHALNKKQDDG
jgi:hypothetical protein